ncbi:hypothetical protein [Raineyella fluvialis]|uniref:Uncharacterized protein n=1 Tax=Raineyella fluvialis TaxID=2662261 RepID=A0A5Q2FED0_9ACTN|nr:hypothetical protein [Raineyella fluvialis]QGF24741.1 hypothetical protein Rai3103_15130 [Raineyella fluvialis]
MTDQTGPVVVTVGRNVALIVSPYSALERVQTIPGRRWDRRGMRWVVPVAALEAVRAAFVDWPGGVRYESRPTPRNAPRTPPITSPFRR